MGYRLFTIGVALIFVLAIAFIVLLALNPELIAEYGERIFPSWYND